MYLLTLFFTLHTVYIPLMIIFWLYSSENRSTARNLLLCLIIYKSFFFITILIGIFYLDLDPRDVIVTRTRGFFSLVLSIIIPIHLILQEIKKNNPDLFSLHGIAIELFLSTATIFLAPYV